MFYQQTFKNVYKLLSHLLYQVSFHRLLTIFRLSNLLFLDKTIQKYVFQRLNQFLLWHLQVRVSSTSQHWDLSNKRQHFCFSFTGSQCCVWYNRPQYFAPQIGKLVGTLCHRVKLVWMLLRRQKLLCVHIWVDKKMTWSSPGFSSGASFIQHWYAECL